MSLIDVFCPSCDHVFEAYRPVADWPNTPPCEKCGGPTNQAFLPRKTTWTCDPVVVFQAPDGSCRFPGDANGQSAQYYRSLGYERVEIRGAAEMRAFEGKMQRQEYSHALRRSEAMAKVREEAEAERRSQLRNEMQHMTAKGRALAREAMRQSDAKPRQYAKEGGFHSEIFSYDRSNRDASYGPDGRRRRS